VEEDHGDDALAPRRLFGVLQLFGSEGDPGSKRAAHAASSDLTLSLVDVVSDESRHTHQEQRSTTKSIDHRSPKPRLQHIYHQDETVELVLVVGTVDTDGLEDIVQVVSCQTGAGELGEDTTAKTEEDTFAIGLCSDYQYATTCSVCKGGTYLWRRDPSIVHSARLV
jgi:hypothetical protein